MRLQQRVVSAAAAIVVAGAAVWIWSSRPAPRAPDGRPHLSGMWGGSMDLTHFEYNSRSPRIQAILTARWKLPEGSLESLYQPWAIEKARQLTGTDDPTRRCLPYGVPRVHLISVGAHPMQIVQTASEVVFLYEYIDTFRVIPTDGRPHRPNPYPTYLGDAVGRWEGDTLVIDIVGFNDATWLLGEGTFHSHQLHVVERFRRVNINTLEYQATVEDPAVLTRPWTTPTRRFKRMDSSEQLFESVCVPEAATGEVVAAGTGGLTP